MIHLLLAVIYVSFISLGLPDSLLRGLRSIRVLGFRSPIPV